MTPNQAALVLDILVTCEHLAMESLQSQANAVHVQRLGPRSYAARRLVDLEREHARCVLAVRAFAADYPEVAANLHHYGQGTAGAAGGAE